MEERKYMEEYRAYAKAKMLECIEDSREIFRNVFEKGDTPEIDRISIMIIASQLFEHRVSPFHYWKQKKRREDFEMRK